MWYLPLMVSPILRLNGGVLENYITCMETKFPVLHILIGDFNAQLGVQAIGHQISARYSKDELTNFAGIQLALLTSQHNKIILNGSTLGDLAGEFTFSSLRGSSVIDFVLVSQLLKRQSVLFMWTASGEGPQILDPMWPCIQGGLNGLLTQKESSTPFIISECLSLYNQALT
ncbi:hypothetical protein E2320_008051, partial [Naja naja]